MDVPDLIRSHDTGPHRSIAVEALAPVPLLVPPLDVPGAHVVDDRIAQYIRQRLFSADAERVPSQDHAKLDLVIQAVNEVIQRYPSAGVVRPVHSFGKIDRVLFFREMDQFHF